MIQSSDIFATFVAAGYTVPCAGTATRRERVLAGRKSIAIPAECQQQSSEVTECSRRPSMDVAHSDLPLIGFTNIDRYYVVLSFKMRVIEFRDRAYAVADWIYLNKLV